MKDPEAFMSDSVLSCENYVSADILRNLKLFSKIVKPLRINLFSVDDFNLSNVNELITSEEAKKHSITSLVEMCKTAGVKFDLIDFRQTIRDAIISAKFDIHILISRKTLEEDSIENLKRKLSELRNEYEIIAVKTDDIKVLKWAAHDRRVDYISVDLMSSNLPIDKALCSLIKQHNKCFELILSPLLLSDNKGISVAIRSGKKIFKLINSTNTQFILTMKPESCYKLRNGIQIRYLAQLLDVPFNRSKMSVFDNQLLIALKNVMKLDKSNLVDGIKEDG
ncbi:MAG: RNase P subunit p30 family protein [Candidatus Heimdallarchaeaceae archaeon]